MSDNSHLSQRGIALGAALLTGLLIVAATMGGAQAGAGYVACDQVTDNNAVKTGCGGAGGYLGAKGGAAAGATVGSAGGPVGTVVGGAVGAFAGAA